MPQRKPISPRLAAAVENYLRYKEDRFSFLTECCFTRDEVAQEDKRIKLIPAKEYLQYVVDDWRSQPRFIMPKSRRMIITWTFLALDLSEALFENGSRVYIVSDDLEKSAMLLDRIVFMFEHIPDEKFPAKPSMKIVRGVKGLPVVISFPATGSSIHALSQNPDEMRQEGATLIHAEEFNIWKWPDKSWQAMLPTVMGGGRIVVIGNAMAGTFFERVIKDELNEVVQQQEIEQELKVNKMVPEEVVYREAA